MTKLSIPAAVMVGVLLSACGGGSGVSVEAEPDITRVIATSRIDGYQALVQRLDDTPPTAFRAMPTTGSASFSGVGGIVVENNPEIGRDDLNLIGDANVTANFADGKVDGRITNMFGVIGSNPRRGEVFDVDGGIVLGANGSSIGRGAPNDVLVGYRGRLTTEDRGTFVVSGRANGKFLGTRAVSANTPDTIKGLAVFDDNAEIRRNGKSVPGEFVLIGTD